MMHFITNRDVAKPWQDDTNLGSMVEEGVKPELIIFIGHLLYVDTSFSVRLLKVSDESDLAILLCSDAINNLPPP